MRVSAAITVLAAIGLLVLAGSRSTGTCAVTLTLVDAETGRELSGLVSIQDADGKRVDASPLLSRGLGLSDTLPIARWSVLSRKTVVQLPQKMLTVTALSGLETEQSTVTVDLTGKSKSDVTISLKRFYDASAHGYYGANTLANRGFP